MAGHAPRRLILGLVCTLMAVSFACSLGGSQPTETPSPTARPPSIALGEPVALTSATVGPAGGTIAVAGTGSPLDGLEIQVPAGAYEGDTPFAISYRTMPEDALGDNVRLLAPLIDIDNGGAYAADLLAVKLPVSVPADHFAMGFYYDPATGELEAIPTVDQDANSLTLVTRHFSKWTAATVPIDFLEKTDFPTGFEPGNDFWHFDNYGSYINPEGFCAGMSLTAIWYYAEEKPVTGEQLWGLFDTYLDASHATPHFWQDDDTAIRLVAVAQNAFDPVAGWHKKMQAYWVKREGMSQDERNFYSTAFALYMTKRPQYLAVSGTGSSGHALICAKKEGSQLLIVDPNYSWDLVPIELRGDTFLPYKSADNFWAALRGATFSYDQIRFFGVSAISDWNLLQDLWLDATSDRIGKFPVKPTDWKGEWSPTYFPAYTLVAVEKDAQNNETEVPLDPMVVYETDQARLEVRVQAPDQFEGRPLQLRVRVYKHEDLGVELTPPVSLQKGDNLLGFLVEGYTAGEYCRRDEPGWCWVGFDWITVRSTQGDEQIEGTGEPDEGVQEPNPCNALADVQVLVKPASVNSAGEPSWITGYHCKASVAFVNTNPDVDVRVLVRRVDESNPELGEWFNYATQRVAPEAASYPHGLHKHWGRDDGIVDEWLDFAEFKAIYTGAGYYHCDALAEDPAATDLPSGVVENPCRDFSPSALPTFSQADCACGNLGGAAETGEGGSDRLSCTYDWGHDAVGLNNIRLTVTRYDSPEAAAEAYASNRDRVATAGAEPGVVTQALDESANSITRVDQQTNPNHVFYNAWWGQRVVRYGKSVILLSLAGDQLGGAGEVIAALTSAQACAEAAVDRYQAACEAVPIGCIP